MEMISTVLIYKGFMILMMNML